MGGKLLTRSVGKPKDVKEAPDSETSGRGPNTKQMDWLKACRKGDLAECKKLLEADTGIYHTSSGSTKPGSRNCTVADKRVW
ncbi:hypothetical protein OSTOST_10384 [Ostertagia ostertagi]